MKTFKGLISHIISLTLSPSELKGTKWLMLPSAISCIVLIVVLVRQTLLGFPVPTRPLQNERVHGKKTMLAWNPVPGQLVHVQVSIDRSFKNIIYENRYKERTFVLVPPVFKKPGNYYWRMRIVRNKHSGGWTRAIKFLVE